MEREGEDGISQIVSSQEPTDDGDGLLVAGVTLAIDEDDTIREQV